MGKNIMTSYDENKTSYFHFTPLETLFKILESGKIRLSACNNIKNIAIETMALEGAIRNFNQADKKILCEKYSCNDEDALIRKLILDREKSYMVCFSKDVDFGNNNYLWKYYSDNNKGVVIEFDYEKFPFKHHSTKGTVVDSQRKRNSEFRIFSVFYDEDKLREKLIKHADLHELWTDSYKPKVNSPEKEIRFIVFLDDVSDITSLTHPIDAKDIREITAEEYDSNYRPTYLYYDIISKNNDGSAIKKVFCRSETTYKILQRLLNNNILVELIEK